MVTSALGLLQQQLPQLTMFEKVELLHRLYPVYLLGARLVALLFFLVAILLALKPSSARWVTTAVVVIAAIAIVAAGIAGAVVGERDIEHHHSSEGTTEGAISVAPDAPIVIRGGAS